MKANLSAIQDQASRAGALAAAARESSSTLVRLLEEHGKTRVDVAVAYRGVSGAAQAILQELTLGEQEAHEASELTMRALDDCIREVTLRQEEVTKNLSDVRSQVFEVLGALNAASTAEKESLNRLAQTERRLSIQKREQIDRLNARIDGTGNWMEVLATAGTRTEVDFSRIVAWRGKREQEERLARATTLTRRAQQEAENRHDGSALVLAEEAARLLPDEPALLFNLGCLLSRAGRFEAAEELATRLERLTPADPSCHALHGLLATLRGDPEAAIIALQAGLDAVYDPRDCTDLLLLMADACDRAGQFESALGYWHTYLSTRAESLAQTHRLQWME